MSRLVKGGAAGGAVAAVMAMATAFIGAKEGTKTRSYRDSVGIWTACTGETKGIGPNMTFTLDECKKMFADRLNKDFAPAVERCVPDAKDPTKMKDETYVAMLSLAYNIGTGGFCKSAIAKNWNAGEHEAACHSFKRYVFARGRYLPGLANRRRDEERMCLKGLR